MPYATALTLTAARALDTTLSQTAMRFHGRVAVDAHYNGLALDTSEGDRIARAMQGADVAFLGNHGVVVCGPRIDHAFDDLYYLERACQAQVLAASTGSPLQPVDAALAARVAAQMQGEVVRFTADIRATGSGVVASTKSTTQRAPLLRINLAHALIETRDPLGRCERIRYTRHWALPLSITDGAGRTQRFGYDSQGNLLWEQDPLGRKTHYRYNAQGRVECITDPLDKHKYLRWNAHGQLLSYRDCSNAQTQADMNQCAAEDYRKADAAMNAQWAETRAAMLAVMTSDFVRTAILVAFPGITLFVLRL